MPIRMAAAPRARSAQQRVVADPEIDSPHSPHGGYEVEDDTDPPHMHMHTPCILLSGEDPDPNPDADAELSPRSTNRRVKRRSREKKPEERDAE